MNQSVFFPSVAMGRFFSMLMLVAFLVMPALQANAQQVSIVLRVLDDDTGDPLEAVYVTLPKRWAIVTNAKGEVSLPTRPAPTDTITVQCVGYKVHRLSGTQLRRTSGVYSLRLRSDMRSLGELVVSGERRSISASSVATKVSSAEIDRSVGQSLADLLERVSGVSTIQTGANTAKPVIHGMHGNRILIVNNGVRQSGQQWGEGHAPEVDMSSSGAINLVKGADGVRYGAEAMGGTIVMEQTPLPYNSRHLSGAVNAMVGSNGRRFAQTVRLEGAVPSFGALAWRIQGSYNNSGDRHTPNYMLNNTGSRGSNLAASLGYTQRGVRLEGFYSRYTDDGGILRSAQLGNKDLLRERIELGRPPEEVIRPFSREIDYPRESVVHHTATLKAQYSTDFIGTFAYQFSFQKDDRREYRIRRNNNSYIPEVALNLTSLQHQLRWQKTYGTFSTELGGQSVHTNNYSTPGNGIVPLIPNYVEHSWGVYALDKYQRGAWSAEAGVRIDGQRTKASGYNHYGRLYGGENKFLNFTYSLGGRYKPNRHWSVTSNFGVAWRAPHVHELYSSGVEHGSGAYLKGDSTLRSEQSYKWVTSVAYASKYCHISVDSYLQWVKNFIYDEPQPHKDPMMLISGAYPLFEYKQTSAFFRGLDVDIELMPHQAWRYTLTTAFIWANEMPSGHYLPYIPPMRIDHQISYLPKFTNRLGLEISLGHRYVSKQYRFDPNKDLIPYSPDAYHLLSAELALKCKLACGHSLSVRLSGDNLLNKEYKEYTNRARYYSHDLGRDVRLSVGWQF